MLGRVKTGQGYSLIEVMVVIAIIAILVLVAIPNYIIWNQKYQLKSEVGNLAGTLGVARMMAINKNTTITATVNQAVPPIPVIVNFTMPGPAGVAVQVPELPTIRMNSVVTLTNEAGGAVGTPQTVGFTPMGLWTNAGDLLGNNICVSAADVPGACPATRQVLNFQNPNAVNHRIVILPTGKVAWCYTGNCVN